MLRSILLISLCSFAGVASGPSEATMEQVPAVAQEQASNSRQTQTAKEKRKKIKSKDEREPAAAAVTSTRNVVRASVTQRSPDGYLAELVIMDGGLAVRNPQDLQMIGSSGSQISDGSRIIFENFVLPFEGTVRFKSPNKMNTVIYERVINFRINEAGSWVVRVEL
ncbi:hypothetical protein C8N40_104139 [Pontibacter mucosus]|uniref:Uncharacterized protein n=1 Tax=Pontibacter mucosus TaxID=1649266 RepID=A0A2T5YJB7_9BACT|nr:hypothetical protein [Pontibacter mucosus]PTX19408.1 hypothetical protein C8N40_104139 [Pontibacter mucosus]